MYNIIKNVIESTRFELTDILKKIDTFWIQNAITEEQKEELVALAREKANPENSHADLQKQVNVLFTKVAELEKEIKSLKSAKPDEEEPEVDEYPEYVTPTGSHDAYHNGDKVTYKGVKYICIAPEGTAVVWSPETYPAFWKVVE